MTENTFALKGDILYAGPNKALTARQNALLLCENGTVAGIFDELPARFAAVPLADYSGSLIIPGLVDLHLHAPQYAFRGLGMDLELLDWLNTRAFPEEKKKPTPNGPTASLYWHCKTAPPRGRVFLPPSTYPPPCF